MTIPEQYPGFQKKTLVVIADHVHAKLFLAHQYNFEFLEEIKTDHSHLEDGDKTTQLTSSGGHSAVVNEKESIIDEDHLFHALAKNLHHKLEEGLYEDLIIAAGPEVHQLEKLLHPDVHARVTQLIPKLLTKLDDEHLIEHLF